MPAHQTQRPPQGMRSAVTTKPGGYGQSSGRQLAKIGALPANECNISKTSLLEPANRFHSGILYLQLVDAHNVGQHDRSQ